MVRPLLNGIKSARMEIISIRERGSEP